MFGMTRAGVEPTTYQSISRTIYHYAILWVWDIFRHFLFIVQCAFYLHRLEKKLLEESRHIYDIIGFYTYHIQVFLNFIPILMIRRKIVTIWFRTKLFKIPVKLGWQSHRNKRIAQTKDDWNSLIQARFLYSYSLIQSHWQFLLVVNAYSLCFRLLQ